MKPVTIYTTPTCGYCRRAKALLQRKNVAYKEIDVSRDFTLRQEMTVKSGQATVPQIWVGDTHVGGCDALYDLESRGELDKLLT